MLKKIAIITGWILCLVAIVVLTGFAISNHNKRPISGVEVSIERRSEHFFISEQDIKTSLIQHGYGLPEQNLGSINIPAIENLIASHAAVEYCDASVTVQGLVHVDIIQRLPVARLINLSGESYYFDDHGKLMPWSENYTAPVMLVNGYFADSYASMLHHDFSSVDSDSSMRTTTLLDDIWNVVNAVRADSMLRMQIVQIYVSPDNGIELVPRVGNHRIIVGDCAGISGKLEKLTIFYTYGLIKTGRWNLYSTIDLRYRNQIVCTKKPNSNGI